MTVRPKPGSVDIPKPELGSLLEETRRLKRDMTRLLGQLEELAIGRDSGKPGGWRRDPTAWYKRHNKD